MAESSILSPILSPTSPPKPKLKKRRPPILRGYIKSPPNPLLFDVRRNITTTLNPPSSSVIYYAFLASKLARTGRLKDFVMVCESVLSGGDSAKFIAKINVKMVSDGIVEVLRNGGFEKVIEFIKDVERVGVRACTLFDEIALEELMVNCTEMVKVGRFEELVQIMEILAGHQFSIQGIIDPIRVLRRFITNRDLDMCFRYARVYPHWQLLFCSMIEEFGKINDLKYALKVFEELKKLGGFNMFAFRSIIDVCGLCGDYIQSRSIFEGLIKEDIIPNVFVFNSLMNVNSHDLNYTLEIYRRMKVLGVQADTTTYNILLKACCNSNRVDLALNIYQDIKSLKLDLYTYGSMIKVLSEANMWETVLTIKQDVISSGVSPNLITWKSLLKSCANCGLVDHALKLFDEMQTSGFQPDVQCYNLVLQACVKSLQFDRAFRLFHLWKDPEMGGFNFKPNVYTMNILMKACGTDYHRAKDLMKDMKKLGVIPDKYSWCTLVDICGEAQNVKGALLAFRDMMESGIKLEVTAFTTIIKACVENQKLEMAFSLFREMKNYGLEPTKVTYNTLLRARTKYGSLYEVQQSLAIYQEMRKAGYSSNDYYLKELIEEWCEGVLCSQNENLSPNLDSNTILDSKKKIKEKPYHALLEKVITHLTQDVQYNNQVIDIRGLSKVEARLVVLFILRMIKENYLLGKNIKENLVIISGTESVGLEVQNAIIHVLKNELGLTVLGGCENKPNIISPDPLTNNGDYKHLARRPQSSGVLRVPVESIHQWLHKKALK